MYPVSEVDAMQLQELLRAQREEVALIDVRTPGEVARGGIPGARNIPLHLLPLRANELAEDKSIVFYCHSGNRSAQACLYMMGRGRANVLNLRGGIIDWLQSGQAISQPLN